MVETQPFRFGGADFILMADRALFWPQRDLLIVADLHLGKADIFRSQGRAVPSGGTRVDLERLSALLGQTGAGRLLVLGDFLHGALVEGPWRQHWDTFRSRHAARWLGVVEGNHDRALSSADLDVVQLGRHFDECGVSFAHAPGSVAEGGALVCGHVHPVLRLPGNPRALPVFWARGGVLVLPAFSAFTGGHAIRPRLGDDIAICDGRALVLVSKWGNPQGVRINCPGV